MEDATAAVVEGSHTAVGTPLLAVLAAAMLVVVGPVLAVLVVFGALLTAVVVGPFLAHLGYAAIVKPVVFGVLTSVADAGFEGSASLGDVSSGLSDGRFRSLAGAYLVVEGALLGVLLVGGLLAVVLELAVGVTSPELGDYGLLVGAVEAVLYLVAVSVLQFVDVAVVLDGASAREAVRRSVRLTSTRPFEVAVYTVMRGLLVAVSLLPAVVLWTVPRYRSVVVPAGGAAVVMLLPLGVGAAVAANVAYYRRRVRR